jgi:hypothetical protein
LDISSPQPTPRASESESSLIDLTNTSWNDVGIRDAPKGDVRKSLLTHAVPADPRVQLVVHLFPINCVTIFIRRGPSEPTQLLRSPSPCIYIIDHAVRVPAQASVCLLVRLIRVGTETAATSLLAQRYDDAADGLGAPRRLLTGLPRPQRRPAAAAATERHGNGSRRGGKLIDHDTTLLRLPERVP